jgi:regulator of protease activity HflC (stomatin/prohibitin superfamily)
MTTFIISAASSFLAFLIGIPLLFTILRFFGLYEIVREKQSIVYVLFGKILGKLEEPGFHFLWKHLGWKALIINLFGRKYKVDLRLDQEYLRSQPVNSEEGAPMGIGIWYEMYISDALAYIFRNTDPRGSLAANVGNSTVRCLSNLPLEKMMVDRHAMSQTVRKEVSSQSYEWGYMLGSCYVRKVHFRDSEMIKQIESKVVNRLRQVTSAIKQDGTNQVNIIRSTAERVAAVDFGKAAAIRPKIVGETLHNIASDPDVSSAMFKVLQIECIIETGIQIEIIPEGKDFLTQMLISGNTTLSPQIPKSDIYNNQK